MNHFYTTKLAKKREREQRSSIDKTAKSMVSFSGDSVH